MMMKKYLRFLRNLSWRYVEAPFIFPPQKGLRPLYKRGWDLHLFSLPYFLLHNLCLPKP